MAGTTNSAGDIVYAVFLLLVLAVGGGAAWWWGRRWWLRERHADGSDGVWTLQQLRELRARGQITDGELERLKAEIISQARASQPDGAAEFRSAAGAGADSARDVKAPPATRR